MDQNRQIRFITPPFFFLLIIILNALCSGAIKVPLTAEPLDVRLIATLITVGAAAVLPLGFITSTISGALLSWWWRLRGYEGSYQACVRNFDQI